MLSRRRRRLRDAGDDLRVLEDARGVDRTTTTTPAEASRPFDRRPRRVRPRRRRVDGRARARGSGAARAARSVYATIDGYGSTCDAYHRVQMDPDGEQIVRAMQLGDRAVRPSARGDRLRELSRHLDRAQRRGRVALRAPVVRRAAPTGVPGSSTKSMIGHPQGASGAAGIVTAALALPRRLPAADDQSSTSPIRTATSTSSRTRAARRKSSAALCNCLGFGSKNSAIVLGKG